MKKSRLTSPLIEPSLSNKLGILILTFIIMIIVVGILKGFVDSAVNNIRTAFLSASVLQALLAFVLPAWLAAFLCSLKPMRYLGISSPVAPRQFAAVVIIMLLVMPAMNLIIDWNANISLPQSMAALEQTMRCLEDKASDMTNIILSGTSIMALISNLLVVGIITGFAEEMFFRAGLQKSMTSSGVNTHLAIWISAFIFSAVHFQFFGFVPRMLLGALFGYMFMTSGSLWVSAWAHALNNSIVVVTAWLSARGYLDFDIETVGVSGSSAFVWCMASVIFTILFSALYWKKSLGAPRQL